MAYRNVDDVDKTMDEINEQTENMKQIQDALSTPIGGAADIDEVNFYVQLLENLLWGQGHRDHQFTRWSSSYRMSWKPSLRTLKGLT